MKMNSFFNKVYDTIRSVGYGTLVTVFPHKYQTIRASVELEKGKLINCNWGDDLNAVIMEFLSSKKTLILPNNRMTEILHIPNYLVIGSILTFYPLCDAVVWGSGIINDQQIDNIKDKPQKILAVRGPRTRAILLEKGIDCPEVYGDPALLMPLFYKPKRTYRYKLGIVPHMKDLKNEAFRRFEDTKGVKFIKVKDYQKWQDFIDDINSCEHIISSSLHGLIISEAYGVPARWVVFETPELGWNFKFWDFYESIGKFNQQPFRITTQTRMDEIVDICKEWVPGSINTQKLIDSCPFDLIEGLKKHNS